MSIPQERERYPDNIEKIILLNSSRITLRGPYIFCEIIHNQIECGIPMSSRISFLGSWIDARLWMYFTWSQKRNRNMSFIWSRWPFWFTSMRVTRPGNLSGSRNFSYWNWTLIISPHCIHSHFRSIWVPITLSDYKSHHTITHWGWSGFFLTTRGFWVKCTGNQIVALSFLKFSFSLAYNGPRRTRIFTVLIKNIFHFFFFFYFKT